MALMIASLKNEEKNLPFEEVRSNLDRILVEGLTQEIWPWWRKRDYGMKGSGIYLEFRSNLGLEPIVQVLDIKYLSPNEFEELNSMIYTFNMLIDTADFYDN